MIGYATTTGTKRNLDAIMRAGWRLILTPDASEPWILRYAIDNGAWGAFSRGEPWNPAGFEQLVAERGRLADFIVAPDIVCGGLPSLDLSVSWLPRLLDVATGICQRVLIPVQNGMEPADLVGLIGPRVGLFVGGDTAWKEATMASWGALCATRRAYLHVGRVNTRRRISLCAAAGVSSFDGTSVTRYSCNLPMLDDQVRQAAMFAPSFPELPGVCLCGAPDGDCTPETCVAVSA